MTGIRVKAPAHPGGVKRHPKLTPDRRPILTPLGVERCGERPTGWSWPGLRSPVGRVG